MDLDDQRVFELAMVENLQREDLNAVDKATAFRDYLGRYGGTQEELAGRLGLDRSTVSNLIRLLELPDEVLDAVRDSEITPGHARALLGLPDARQPARRLPADHRREPVGPPDRGPGGHRHPHPGPAADPPRPGALRRSPRLPHLVELEQHLHQRFGTTVLIRAKTPERGQIIIDYNSQEEFDRVTSLIR